MKTWLKLALLSVVAVMLGACGFFSKSPQAPIFFSEAVQSDSLWYDVHHENVNEFSEYDTVSRVYHFIGDGKVIVYDNLELILGDFAGKSDKEILEMVEKQDERNFYRHKEKVKEMAWTEWKNLYQTLLELDDQIASGEKHIPVYKKYKDNEEAIPEDEKEVYHLGKVAFEARKNLKYKEDLAKSAKKYYHNLLEVTYTKPAAVSFSYTLSKTEPNKDVYPQEPSKDQVTLKMTIGELEEKSLEYHSKFIEKKLTPEIRTFEVKDSYFTGVNDGDTVYYKGFGKIIRDAFITAVKKGQKGVILSE